MAENPDRASTSHGKFAPSQGDLRIIHRMSKNQGVLDVIQRWEWSYTDARFDWYDVPVIAEIQDEEEAD